MNNVKLSLYGYLFRARAANLDLDAAVANFTAFAEETVIATLAAQDDDTLDRLLQHEATLDGRLKIVVIDMDIDKNNRFDGDLKTAAMRDCTHPVRIIADCDERFILGQRPLWDALAEKLFEYPILDGWLLPVLDLYGDADHVREDQLLGQKFRMHRDTVVRRGVPAFAEMGRGLFDTSASDSTEPLINGGQLASFVSPYSHSLLHPSNCRLLADKCYVVHYGFLDLAKRAELGRTFWAKHWSNRSGKPEKVATRVEELLEVARVRHNLPLA